MISDKFIFWLEEIGANDNDLVGNKCAKLGEMTQMGLRIPPGFAVSAKSYERFVEKTGTAEEISRYVKTLGKLEGIGQFEEVSQTVRAMIEGKDIPDDLMMGIGSAYRTLCAKIGISDAPVAVRSSGLAEDSAGASYAGQYESYLNVKGEKEVLNRVKKVWSSAFTARAVSYRTRKGLPLDGDSMAVAVLGMVNARTAGIGFTVDPVTGDSTRVIIEANWGLGEGVVCGVECVDHFVVDKESLKVTERNLGKKVKCVVNKEEGADWDQVPEDMHLIPCLNDEEIGEITRIARDLEEYLGGPQDIEWAIDPDLPLPHSIFLLQTRPAGVQATKPESTTDRMIDMITKRFFRP